MKPPPCIPLAMADTIDSAPLRNAPGATIVGEFSKNSRERVTGSLEQFQGHPFAHLRVTVPLGGPRGGGRAFTQKGISLPVTQLPQLLALVTEMTNLARDLGLFGPLRPPPGGPSIDDRPQAA